MKAPCLFILIVIQLSTTADCCSSDINTAVDNAFVSCSTSVSCVAECYRGYIFPSGLTKEHYNCQNGQWTPTLSLCKRIPIVSVMYAATWSFTEVLVSHCKNITSQLEFKEKVLEDTLSNNCNLLNISAQVQLTYSFSHFQIRTIFTAVYNNFTNWNNFNLCTRYNTETFPNLQNIKSTFDGVTCGNLTTINAKFETLHVNESQMCPNDMELYVTSSDDRIYSQYCDIGTTVTISEMTSKTRVTQISIRTPGRPTLVTEVSFADNYFNSSQSTTLKNEVLSTDENSNISQGTTITEFFTEKDVNVNSIVYIVAPVGGIFLISLIIILIVCLQKRVKDPENLTDDMKMTQDTKHRKDETSFKGEMIENELYKSADDVLDWDSNVENTRTVKSENHCSSAPYFKEKSRKQVTVNEDEYSYPSKISKCKETRLSVAFDDDTDCDVKARGVLQTPNHDSKTSCHYAVVNKTRKI